MTDVATDRRVAPCKENPKIWAKIPDTLLLAKRQRALRLKLEALDGSTW